MVWFLNSVTSVQSILQGGRAQEPLVPGVCPWSPQDHVYVPRPWTCPGALGTRYMSLVPKSVHGHLPFLSPASVDPLVFSAPLYLLIKVYVQFQIPYLSHKGSGGPHASPPTYQDTGSDSISPSFSNHVRTSANPRTDFL